MSSQTKPGFPWGGYAPQSPGYSFSWAQSGFVYTSCFLWLLRFGLGPWEVAPRFSNEISRVMYSKSCLGTPWGPRYGHVCKTCIVTQIVRGCNYS